jgi:hypothetical protein
MLVPQHGADATISVVMVMVVQVRPFGVIVQNLVAFIINSLPN